jgi:hypothetical protein
VARFVANLGDGIRFEEALAAFAFGRETVIPITFDRILLVSACGDSPERWARTEA